MARKLRIQCPGAIYRVVNRGGHRERIFARPGHGQRQLYSPAVGDGNPAVFSALALPEGARPRRAGAIEATQPGYMRLSLTDTFRSSLSSCASGSSADCRPGKAIAGR
jgi:hypothetical protein